MLDRKGFDLWAEGYDNSVHLSEESDQYPFAGYKKVLGSIYETVRSGSGKTILDIGFGTAVLSKKLYDDGYPIYGMDFSEKMRDIAAQKMPLATLVPHDFTQGFPECFHSYQFDVIICTYAIHHLEHLQKIHFIKEMIRHLSDGGQVLIGDVAFQTTEDRNACRKQCGDDWDEDEDYCVAEVLKPAFPQLQFQPISFCAGVFTLRKE